MSNPIYLGQPCLQASPHPRRLTHKQSLAAAPALDRHRLAALGYRATREFHRLCHIIDAAPPRRIRS